AAVLIIAMVSQALGNVYLAKAMKAIMISSAAAGEGLFATAVRAGASPRVWLGTFLLIGFFLFYSPALSWADLSFVLPTTAFGYVLNVAAGRYLLSESVTPARWAGSVIITFGVFLVSRSGVRTLERPEELTR